MHETIETYARKWLAFIPLVKKPSTVGFYRDHLENHVIPALGPTPVAALTRSQCKQFALKLRDKKLARATMVGILTTLSALLSAAVDDERAVATSVAASSRVKYFDWNDRFILVQRAWVRGAWTTPKNGEERAVDLSAQLVAAHREWQTTLAKDWMARGRPRPDLVFPSSVETPLDDSRVRKAVGAIVRKAKLRHRNVHAPHVHQPPASERRVPRLRAEAGRAQINGHHDQRLRALHAGREPRGGGSPG